MKILLLQPPIQDFYDTDIRLQPLGLCMLKSAVGKSLPEVEVVVRDYHQGHGRRTIPIPPELRYLKEYYPYPDASPFCTFHEYYHFGAPFEQIGSEVEKEEPDLIGISSLFSAYHREAASCAREIRERTDAPIIMGGPHVSASPMSVLEDSNVDFVVVGEGERVLVEFLRCLISGSPYGAVEGLGYKKDGRAVLNPPATDGDFETLPFPDFSDLPPERYELEGRPLCFITTSRGCPHRCGFCSVHLTFPGGFRRRRPEQVMAEMEMRYSEGYRFFDFEDDNLTFHRSDFRRLLLLIARRWQPGDVRFAAMNGVSYMSLDQEILRLMREAGFRDLNLSLVSAEERSLAAVNRPHTLQKFLDTVEGAHSLGFRIVAYQIAGLPMETLDMMAETMALLARLPVLIGVSIFYLTPGSPMAASFSPGDGLAAFMARSTTMATETANFCRDDLYSLFVTARIINFLKDHRGGKETADLERALESVRARGRREGIGCDLLMRLFEERRLYAATPQGHKLLPRFRPELFFDVVRRARVVRTRDGGMVRFPDC
jgi:hypothetical protein